MGLIEKIKEIEDEMARTQKNKATEYHMGQLKAKLAKYRTQLLEPPKSGPKGEGFEVQKFGNARVCMIGFPSVGKVYTQPLFESPQFYQLQQKLNLQWLHMNSQHQHAFQEQLIIKMLKFNYLIFQELLKELPKVEEEEDKSLQWLKLVILYQQII